MGATPESKANKVLTKAGMIDWLNVSSTEEVDAVPANPIRGQQIIPLADIVVENPGILTAQADGDGRTAGWFGTQGSSDPTPTTISGVLSYASVAQNNVNVRNRIAVQRGTGNIRIPATLELDGTSYPLSTTPTLSHFFRTANNTASNLVAGQTYTWNIIYSDNTKLFPDITLIAGATYTWTGNRWLETGTTIDQIQRFAREEITERVSPNALTANITEPVPKFRFVTQAQFDAITSKDPETLYYVRD